MLQLTGTYDNGTITLERIITTYKPLRIVVTFQDEPEMLNDVLKLSDFSFLETQELLKDYHGSFSDEVVKERRLAL